MERGTEPGSIRLVLASASPRRRALLEAVGLAFDVAPASIDESLTRGEGAEDAAVRLAEAKARRVAADRPGRPVLGADTLVEIDGALLGKPTGAEDARAMLRRLSGRWHAVVTGVALVRADGTVETGRSVTRVRFSELGEDEIARYVRGGEPFGKAGGYAIQGAGGWLVEEIRGSASNVVGLPLETVRRLLTAAGVRPTLAAAADDQDSS